MSLLGDVGSGVDITDDDDDDDDDDEFFVFFDADDGFDVLRRFFDVGDVISLVLLLGDDIVVFDHISLDRF